MSGEQDFLRKCNQAFPGIGSKPELSFQELEDFMTVNTAGGKAATEAQQALLKELSSSKTFIGSAVENRLQLEPPASISKLAVAASECIRINKKESQRVSYEYFASTKVLPTVEQKLAEAILKNGPETWAPIWKLQGKSSVLGGGYKPPETHPPSLTLQEETIKKALETIPHVDVILTPDDKVLKEGNPTFDISVRLKQRK